MTKTAIVFVDLQNDFCPGGALAVADGDAVIAVANQWAKDDDIDLVIATQDWHPKDHKSFASNHPGCEIGDVIEVEGLEQILWPDHCVQETKGAEFHPKLDQKAIDKVIRKGTDPDYDSYSAFFDNGHRFKTDLDSYLQSQMVRNLFIMGLATDYCVKFTVLDALDLGYNVCLIEEGCRGVNIHPRDCDQAIRLMKTKGAKII